MTNWTARIDALLAAKPEYPRDIYDHHNWQVDRLSLAAERLREPHDENCEIRYVKMRVADVYNCLAMKPCTCGKDDDLRRILEGK